ncbi:MAG: DUF2892 domain-containing protein [Pseudanabaena sp. Salubria-1]|nr:DUF2892 domain-containing protein [Pseudanabaena sp. Salubria-1]
MNTNVGAIDRLIRLLLAAGLFYLGFFLYGGTGLGIGLIVMGGIMLVTALVGFCGLYQLLGIRTNKLTESLHGK